MGGSGGGGPQTSETKNSAQYPDEFKPLAAGAAQQLLSLQSALPVSQFANPHQAQIAGLSPFQQATMNFLPQTLAPTWGLQQMQNMSQPINTLANNSLNVGNNTGGFNQAMQALFSGGLGSGHQAFPGMTPPTAPHLQGVNAVTAPQQTVVGPNTANLVSMLQDQLNGQPIPASTPILPPL